MLVNTHNQMRKNPKRLLGTSGRIKFSYANLDKGDVHQYTIKYARIQNKRQGRVNFFERKPKIPPNFPKKTISKRACLNKILISPF